MIRSAKKLCRALAISLSATMVISLTACIQKPVEEESTSPDPWSGKEELKLPESDEALKNRYEDLKSKATLAFTTSSVTDAAAFETETVDDGLKIVKYLGNESIVVIPEAIDGTSVIAIAQGAFTSTPVTALYIPDSVKIIEKGALEDTDKLATLRIPFIGDGGENSHFGYIFNCDSYESQPTKVPATLDMVIVGSGERIAENAFAGCKGISAIILPYSISSIEKFAFYECSDLVYLDVKGVTSVGNYAMGHCSSLYAIDLLSAESIGFGALYSADSLYSLTTKFVGGSESENRYIGYIFGAETADFNDEFTPNSLRSVTLTDTSSIPDRAFASCAYITEIIIPEGVASIGIRAFYSCRGLEKVKLPDTLKTIGDDAFFACDGLKSVSFGNGLESIGMQAFFACRSLDGVVIPNGVKTVGASAFALCSSLKSVTVSESTILGKDAFLNCPYSQN